MQSNTFFSFSFSFFFFRTKNPVSTHGDTIIHSLCSHERSYPGLWKACQTVKSWSKHKRFKRTLISFNTDTQYANFRGTPLYLISIFGVWNLELGFEMRQVEEFSQTDRQRIPEKWIDETERVQTKRFNTTFKNFQKPLAWGWEGEMNT